MQRSWSSPDARGGVGGGATERDERDITTVGKFVKTKITTTKEKQVVTRKRPEVRSEK